MTFMKNLQIWRHFKFSNDFKIYGNMSRNSRTSGYFTLIYLQWIFRFKIILESIIFIQL